MPTIQVRVDNTNEPLVLSSDARMRTGITIEASAGDLLAGTVLGEVTADPGVYLPVDATATDGSQLPKLILAEDVADNVAQQAGKSAYEGGVFAEEKLAFGGTTDLDTRLVIETNIDLTMRDALRMFGLFTAPTVSLSGFENS